MTLLLVGVVYFGLVVWAGMLWGAIRLLDRDNAHNTFLRALLWSAINVALNQVFAPLGMIVLAAGIAYLVISVRVLIHYYELGVWKTLGVIGLLIATPFVVMPSLADWVGGSMLRALFVLYGIPTGILVTWQIGRRRIRRPAGNLPEARLVTRGAREPEPPAEPAEPTGAAPAEPTGAAPEPAPAPPVPAPRISQPIVPVQTSAPEIEVPASPTEGPRFLR